MQSLSSPLEKDGHNANPLVLHQRRILHQRIPPVGLLKIRTRPNASIAMKQHQI